MNVHQTLVPMAEVVQITLTDTLVHVYLGILEQTARQVFNNIQLFNSIKNSNMVYAK